MKVLVDFQSSIRWQKKHGVSLPYHHHRRSWHKNENFKCVFLKTGYLVQTANSSFIALSWWKSLLPKITTIIWLNQLSRAHYLSCTFYFLKWIITCASFSFLHGDDHGDGSSAVRMMMKTENRRGIKLIKAIIYWNCTRCFFIHFAISWVCIIEIGSKSVPAYFAAFFQVILDQWRKRPERAAHEIWTEYEKAKLIFKQKNEFPKYQSNPLDSVSSIVDRQTLQ